MDPAHTCTRNQIAVQIVQERLGRTIKGQLEQGTLYTHLFIERCKAQMRAAFSAITRYTPI
jgi:hypothetical protein